MVATEQPQRNPYQSQEQRSQKPWFKKQEPATTESGIEQRHTAPQLGGAIAVPEASRDVVVQSTRKLLTPHIVARPPKISLVQRPPPREAGAKTMTIIFKARNERGEWERVHEVGVDPFNPSEVERVAKKDARNRHATFYDKNMRSITPARCFDAAVEDGTNTIFMVFEEKMAINEKMVASVSQALDSERKRRNKRR
ncbi:hypothetical protein CPSG_10105 [Coccidioides posadasii str. Silveira]|uniref:Uncharacterized protein n=2 Tax=Coccidioides posadasii (strain RMSCC 757 / Silveira) TaxID=443226 RepID=E9DJV6_COCPS|nr:hypothetical protein CPSG_10105 [Coccidioides posadasii str. Silveira]